MLKQFVRVSRSAKILRAHQVARPFMNPMMQRQYFGSKNDKGSAGWSPVASDETEAATIASTKEYLKAAKDGEDEWI